MFWGLFYNLISRQIVKNIISGEYILWLKVEKLVTTRTFQVV